MAEMKIIASVFSVILFLWTYIIICFGPMSLVKLYCYRLNCIAD